MPGPGRNYRISLAWPRLPAAAEVAIVAAGYAGYALVRLAVRASHPAAVAHAAGLWRAERWLHVDIEPSLNHLAAARPALAEIAIYRDVSLAVMAHLGGILGWPRPKAAVLAAGIRGVYAYERAGGWRRMVSLRMPARRDALGGPVPARPGRA